MVVGRRSGAVSHRRLAEARTCHKRIMNENPPQEELVLEQPSARSSRLLGVVAQGCRPRRCGKSVAI
jgi:hypothetical protein